MSLSYLLDKVLTKQNDFCCVCFGALQAKVISLDNEFTVNINNVESKVDLNDVLSTILNEETLDYVSEFNCLCLQCTEMAITSYIFLKKAKENTELLTKIIEGITSGLTKTVDYDQPSLYLTLNTEDFSTKQYIDSINVSDVSVAYKRLNFLHNNDVKPKIENELSYEYGKKKSRTKPVSQTPIEKILFDPTDTKTMKCRECLKVYPTIWNLRSHYIRVHAPKLYKCSECPMKFGSKGCLNTHKAESHCTVVCSVCGKVFHNRHTLKMHEKGHHIRLVCQKCGRIYKNKTTFNKHIEYNVCGKKSRASPLDAKFECDYCHKKYTQKMSLRVHIQFEHGNYKSYNCEWCPKRFWCKSRLNAHIVKHTQEKKFHCSICDRNFVTKESLLYHTRIHTGEKPYACTQCDARFLSASRRSEHVKRHHGLGTFQCDICQGKFNSQNYLQKHKRIHLLQESEAIELKSPKDITQPPDAETNQLILQSHQIPNLSTVYNYNEIYFEVAHDDYNIKIEQ
ncbi:zinc finger protein-like [Plodia interpunctella]|uniref:zinc finger protein-like n=1 Tax=Plodia interpunctella TaxID=58824 RepID=UPI002367936D|nr:zinc finger protein-like [Plodia interpunctella]